jgi:hypothetical protein
MPIFTEFQLRCEEALRELLEYRGMRLNREVVGNGETYVHGAVEGTDVEVWIYDDEAEYRSGRKRRNFEAAVFRDESERIASFIKEVQAELGF